MRILKYMCQKRYSKSNANFVKSLVKEIYINIFRCRRASRKKTVDKIKRIWQIYDNIFNFKTIAVKVFFFEKEVNKAMFTKYTKRELVHERFRISWI